ncbi:histidine phosphatase family protein [Cryptosporangium sp. NPDC048952]|uniref:histidine phosphatase family protein n=1 Tax=Cryptosporangium sp. NPDC048952 TaxID=3363961 RepID=UPI003721C916
MTQDDSAPVASTTVGATGAAVILVRHGETEWSKSGQHTSRTDLPLTENGEAVALALKPVLATALGGRPPVLALSSPLTRARRTAELADVPVELDGDLREVDYGEYEGITTPQIRERDPGWSVWTHPNPGGETVEQAGQRVDRVLDRARKALPQGHVVLFAHGHILRVLAARWLGLPASEGRLFALDTATLGVLGTEHDLPVIRRWNAPAAWS